MMEERYASYQREPENTVDVLFLGSSPVFTDIVPMVLWQEEGFTSVNLGTSMNSAPLVYQVLQFALKNQHPKLVVLDLCALFEDRKADEMELPYRKIVGAMPDREVKSQMIDSIVADNEGQQALSWYFPLLRFHDRWVEVTESSFQREYLEYRKGCALYDQTQAIYYNRSLFEREITEEAPLSEYSLGYYQKVFALCREEGIPVAVAVYPSAVSETYLKQYNTLERLCRENGLSFYQFNTPESWEAFGLNAETDFYNGGHMNTRGGIRLSKHIAEILSRDFSLPDHRGEPGFERWQEQWEEFTADYREVLEEIEKPMEG